MGLQELNVTTKHQSFSAISNVLEGFGVVGICKEELASNQSEIIVKGYIKNKRLSDKELELLKEKLFKLREYNLDIGVGKIELKSLKEEDWAYKWQENFKTIKITDKIVIKPVWEEYEVKDDEVLITINPGRAFGTGYHETTRGCLEMLSKYINSNYNVIDVGTGTGILAIAANKLGADSVLALDIDPVAVENARSNATLNKVSEEIKFKEGNLLEGVTGTYHLAVVNILPHIIINLIPDLDKVLKSEGYCILSGIIEEKKDEVREELLNYGFEVVEIIQRGDWVTIVGRNI